MNWHLDTKCIQEGWKPGAGQEISAERESIRLWLREKEALTGE